jgi:AcrR family transcriptional regulator
MRSTVRKTRIPNPESRVTDSGSRVTNRETAARAGTLIAARAGTQESGKPKPLSFPEGTPRLEQIRRVGCRLLYQYGYAGMTMREVAAQLHIKAASLYHHFPSKQHILFDLMHETATELLRGLERIVEAGTRDSGLAIREASEPQSEPRPSGGAPSAARRAGVAEGSWSPGANAPSPALRALNDPLQQLDAAIRWHVLFHTQRREEAFVSHSEMRSLTPANLAKILTVRERYETVFGDILLRCRRQGLIGEMKPPGDIRVVRNAILTMCTATAGWFNPGGRLTAGQVADEMVAFVRNGLLRSEPPFGSGR